MVNYIMLIKHFVSKNCCWRNRTVASKNKRQKLKDGRKPGIKISPTLTSIFLDSDWVNMHSHLILIWKHTHTHTHTHTHNPVFLRGSYHLSIIMWSLWDCNKQDLFPLESPSGDALFQQSGVHKEETCDPGYGILSRGMQEQDSMDANTVQFGKDTNVRMMNNFFYQEHHSLNLSSSVFPLKNLLVKFLLLLATKDSSTDNQLFTSGGRSRKS